MFSDIDILKTFFRDDIIKNIKQNGDITRFSHKII